MGEMPKCHTVSAVAAAMAISHQRIPLAKPMMGVTMSATTAGRIPIKAASTQWLWRIWLKNVATSSIITNEGTTTPSIAASAPLYLRYLYPTNTAVLSDIGPGAA